MFINDVNKKEEIRTIAIQYLRKYGIKYRDKNTRRVVQVARSKRFFNIPLQNLENETVTLKNGQQLIIPKRLYEMCSFIFTKVETEGIFRKEGSKSRQNEIKLLLNRGCSLGDDHHVIDVAVILKCFLRELPEPLIPFSYQELFLRCSIIEKKLEAILLACLLLPTEHLNVLAFLMQFLNEVANYAMYNKMNSFNIAVLVGPNIFPINEKIAPKSKLMLTKICDIIKLMIENSRNIGLIPDYIIEQIGSLRGTEVDVVEKIKRRRSGSLTRIFNGLKKIVGNKPDETFSNTVTPDLLLTPSISSSKKLQEHNKPQRRRRMKDEEPSNRKAGAKTMLERRWSAITHATNFKRKKRNSLIDLPSKEYLNLVETIDKHPSKAEYVKVSKSEYEEIKNRVSAIEKRLSLELENVQSTIIDNDNNGGPNNIIQNIQCVYEKTLVEAEPLSPSTDQLAKRLGKELRIRASEHKMIRSPSARKIGNMRRRSRDLEKPSNKVVINHSQQFVDNKQIKLIRHVSSSTKSHPKDKITSPVDGQVKRTASFPGRYSTAQISCNSSMHISVNSSEQSPEREIFNKNIFSGLEILHKNEFVTSSSKLKNHNIGIYQNTILFDRLCNDTPYTNTISVENLANNFQTLETELKITPSKTEGEYKNKTLKYKENKASKQNVNIVRRNANVKQRGKNEKFYVNMRRVGRNNKENGVMFQNDVNKSTTEINHLDHCTPKLVPHIKRPMILKSPKRLCSTPQKSSRNTPLKVLSTPKYFSSNI